MTSPSDAAGPYPQFDDVMIDIETMSLHPHNALILSIGLVEFNPRSEKAGLQLGRRLLIIPSLVEQLVLGRHVDPKTQKWWMDQPDKSKAHWLNISGERRTMSGTITDVRLFVQSATRVWANGTQFDLSNLAGLADQMNKMKDPEPLWHYRAPRDMRTFCEETPATRNIGEIGPAIDLADKFALIPHEPVSDAIAQAYRVWEHWPRGDSM